MLKTTIKAQEERNREELQNTRNKQQKGNNYI